MSEMLGWQHLKDSIRRTYSNASELIFLMQLMSRDSIHAGESGIVVIVFNEDDLSKHPRIERR
jgi:hypothetical protein